MTSKALMYRTLPHISSSLQTSSHEMKSHNILKNVAHKMGRKQTEVLCAYCLIMNAVMYQ